MPIKCFPDYHMTPPTLFVQGQGSNIKGVVIIYGRGWGGVNLKNACTQNLPPPLGTHTLRFCPPWILRTEILPPPYPSVPIHLHVNLLEVMVVRGLLLMMGGGLEEIFEPLPYNFFSLGKASQKIFFLGEASQFFSWRVPLKIYFYLEKNLQIFFSRFPPAPPPNH